MTTKIKVNITGGQRLKVEAPVPAGSLLVKRKDGQGLPYIGCLVNNEVCSMSYPVEINCSIGFITMAHPLGMRMYRDSLSFLLEKTVKTLFPDSGFMIQHSLGAGLYYTFDAAKGGSLESRVKAIESKMREYVESDLPVERRKIAFADVVDVFKKNKQLDKLNLLKFKNPQKITMHFCDGFFDIAHSPLVSRTSMLSYFKLMPYPPGFILLIPDRSSPKRIKKFQDQPHLFNIFKEHKEWGRILGLNTVGKLNETIASGGITEFIRIAEALHEKKIACIADQISARKDKIKLILVSGPSASGKTTFLKRLAVQLMVNGVNTFGLSLDNYYVNDEDNPRDDSGQPDYEHVEALDIALLNKHLQLLLKGREVELPVFDFITKKQGRSGKTLRLDPGQMLIIEGIHGLNPRLTHMVEKRNKFLIYLSALTQLNIDSGNRISTTDNRLMRRLIRDYVYRGNSAVATLRMWPSVRRGEKTWIFPFQKMADAVFNSALDYELAVIKPVIEPILMEVKPSDPEYAEARRLSRFLAFFLGASRDAVPPTSILREFVGSSSFEY